MHLFQSYETRIWNNANELAVTYFVIPARAVRAPEIFAFSPMERLIAARDALDVNVDVCEIKLSHLPLAMAAILTAAGQKHSKPAEIFYKALSTSSVHQVEEIIGVDTLSFAENLCFQDVIPFEASPVAPVALASLLAKSGGVGVGAYVGFTIGTATPPLLLITVPAGMIVCGAAAGIAVALEEGLRGKIAAWLQGKNAKQGDKKPSERIKNKVGSKAAEDLEEIAKDFSKEISKSISKIK